MRRTPLLLPLLPVLLLAGCADHPLPTAVAPEGAALSTGPGDYVVTTTANSGSGSLRAAILAAQGAAGAKTITFDIPAGAGGCSAGVCTITLASELQVSKADGLTIDGSGQRITLSGGNSNEVIINEWQSVLTVKHLTIANGDGFAGGGIVNDEGTLTVSHSTFSGNSAHLGGGIYNFRGTLTVSHSTFSANSATTVGGGIYSYTGTVTISHSTFSGNRADAGGGMVGDAARTTISHSTFSGNSATSLGAGVVHLGLGLRIKNSIIANSPSGTNCYALIDESSEGNLSTDDSCELGFTQVSSAALNLGLLADNDGPTQTHALGTGSVAIDAVTDCTEWNGSTATTDQRGYYRVAPCDIGAYEYGATTTPPPASYTFVGFTGSVKNPNVLNVAKAGQTIPLQWRLLDGSGTPVTTLSSVTVRVESLSCSAGTTQDKVRENAAGKSGLQNLGGGYYQYNWATPKSYANSCKTLTLTLGDGIGLAPQALFKFTR